MAFNIPMPPANFGGGLLEGLVTGIAAKQNRQSMEQDWQKHLQNLALRQQQEARLRQLFPHELALLQAQTQQAQGAAAKSNMFARLLAGDEGYNSGMPPPTGMDNYVPPPPNVMGIGNPGEGPPTNLPPTNEDYSALERQIKEAQTNPNYGQKGPLNEYEKGKETVINPGNPRLRGLDNVAGLPGGTKIHTHYDADGNLIKMYPSGKVTVTPYGKTAQEKGIIETAKKGEQEKNKLNIKEQHDLSKEIPIAESKLEKAERLLDILEKQPQVKEWFGVPTPLMSPETAMNLRARGINDELFGEMQTLFADLVAPMSQELSTRGLATALNFAIGSKPSFLEEYTTAKGKTKAIVDKMRKSLEIEKKRLAELSGQKTNDGMLRGRINGKETPVHPSNREEFESEGGVIL